MPSRLALLAVLAVLALLLTACPAADDAAGPQASEPGAATHGDVDLDVTTVEDFSGFADEGLARWEEEVPGIADIRIASSADGSEQPALWLPPDEEGRPLLLVLHTWSTAYQQHLSIPYARWAAAQGWGFIHPDFRGVNDNPEATGSDLAVSDVVDAIDHAVDEGGVDADRVYAVGFSGGGMMALLVAGRHPDRIAAAATWAPNTHLVELHAFFRDALPEEPYAEQVEDSCGGDPQQDPAAREECLHRSPVTHLDGARDAGVPVYLAHGIDDALNPPSQSLLAFDVLADDGDALGEEVAAALDGGEVPPALEDRRDAEHHLPDGAPDVLAVATSGAATLVLFDGDHDMVYEATLRWLLARG
jgi:poly(3-hydroxybutyrate) depolymerase